MKQSGNTLRQKRTGSFRVVEKIFSADTYLARHAHQTAYVCFLLGGSYSEAFLEEERICWPGTVIWHPRTETHVDRFHSNGGHLLDLEIEAGWLSDAEQQFKLVSGARMFRGGLPYLLGLGIYRQLSGDACETEDAATELLSFFFAGPRTGIVRIGSTALSKFAANFTTNSFPWQSSPYSLASIPCMSPALFAASWDARSAIILPKSTSERLANFCATRKIPSWMWHTLPATRIMPTCAEH